MASQFQRDMARAVPVENARGAFARALTAAFAFAAIVGTLSRPAAAGTAAIEIVEDVRTLETLGYALIDELPCEGDGCPTFAVDEQSGFEQSDADAFDALVPISVSLDERPGAGGEASGDCASDQTSNLALTGTGSDQTLEITALGSTSASASVDDPNVAASSVDCTADSFLEIDFTLLEARQIQLTASLVADILVADLFQPGNPFVGAPLNGAFATLSAIDVPSLPINLFDVEIHDEGDTDDPKDMLVDGVPVLGGLDESTVLGPGEYRLSVGAATVALAFENADAEAAASFDVRLFVPEPALPFGLPGVLVALGALARRRRGAHGVSRA